MRYRAYLSTLVVGSLIYYFDKNYYRKYKGLKKIRQIYRTDDEMVSSKHSIADIIKCTFSQPLAILFPAEYDTISKQVQMCYKYGLAITNDDISQLKDELAQQQQSKHFVNINQRKLLKLEVDTQSLRVTAGAGWRLEDLNRELVKLGYYLPINANHGKQRLYQLVNQNNQVMDTPQYGSIAEILDRLLVVLPNGSLIQVENQHGLGINMKDIFIGANGSTGLLCEAVLRLHKLPLF